jgi:EmrB/QacA subfamily drug resistance transporter
MKASTINNKQIKWLLVLAMAALVFLGNFDFTAVILAVPTIAKNFHASISQLQWILVGYIITSAAFIIVNPHVCSFIGQKKTFLLGCGIFIFTSLMAGFATNLDILIIARFIQGIGYALAFPLIYTFVFDMFPENERGIAISILHFTTAIAQAVGPVLGGCIIYLISWRFIFFINLPLCGAAALLIYKVISKNEESKNLNFEILNSILFALLGLIALMLVLNSNNVFPQSHEMLSIFILLSITVMSFTFLFFKEKKTTHHLLKWSLFNNKNFLYITIIRFIIQIVFTAFLYLPALYLQSIFNFNSQKTGLIYLSMTSIFAITSIVSGKLIDHIEPKCPLYLGVLCLLVGSLLCAISFSNLSLSILIPALIMAGLGLGLVFPASLYLCLNSVSMAERANASSIFLMIALMGCSFSAALSSWILNWRADHVISSFITKTGMTFSQVELHLVDKLMTGITSTKKSTFSFLEPKQVYYFIEKTMSTFSDIMILNVIMAVVAFFLCFKLSNKSRVIK